MAYKSGHIYLIDHEPSAEELANFAKPVQFDVCENGQFYSILFDKNGNKFIEQQSKVVTGFIKIGEVTQDGSQISIGVHPSGFNHWRINGIDVTTSQPSVLEVDPVADGEFRKDWIVGNSAGGLFILPGEAGKFPIAPNPLQYPSFAFLLEVQVTPEGIGGGGIVTLKLSNVFTGDGNTTELDVKPSSEAHPGTMSAAHYTKLEGITNTLINQWSIAYGWGNHASAGYASATSLVDKLDKVSGSAQTVASSVTFTGNVSSPKLILQVQSSNTTVGAIWADGQYAFYNGNGGTPKRFLFEEDLVDKTIDVNYASIISLTRSLYTLVVDTVMANISFSLSSPIAGRLNEYMVQLSIGATLPSIGHPSGIIWRYGNPEFRTNTTFLIIYQAIYTANSWKYYGVVIPQS